MKVIIAMPTQSATFDQVAREIDDLHDLFVAWYAAAWPKQRTDFDARMGRRMDRDFSIITPTGQFLKCAEILDLIYDGHGRNSAFRIKTRNVQLLRGVGDQILATYEEWQHHAVNSDRGENGRLSSALFAPDESQPNGLRWLHVHETWLPDDVVAAGDFDF